VDGATGVGVGDGEGVYLSEEDIDGEGVLRKLSKLNDCVFMTFCNIKEDEFCPIRSGSLELFDKFEKLEEVDREGELSLVLGLLPFGG
jgi:coenzyme F420-reducing hydrogenase delta subunit